MTKKIRVSSLQYVALVAKKYTALFRGLNGWARRLLQFGFVISRGRKDMPLNWTVKLFTYFYPFLLSE